MKENFYILENGNLRADEKVFRFDSKNGMRRLPVETVRSINFYGSGNITTGSLVLSSKNNIVFHFYGYYGNYIGSFYPKEQYFSGDLSVEQSGLYLNSIKRLELCNILVNGIIRNMKVFLNKHGVKTDFFDNGVNESSVEKLMLAEARVRKKYYSFLDMILPEEYKLNERVKHPPNNFGNTLISFGNSRLYAEFVTQSRYVSLNPSISFYHSPESSRYSLVLDISEVFKPYIVDQFVIKIIKKGIITTNDFQDVGNGILLNKTGMKKFIQNWEKWLDESYYMDKLKRKVSNKELMKMELFKLIKHYMKIETYSPFIMS